MKLTIFLLIALFTVSLAEPSCDLDSMCMSCDASTADKCTGCYNGIVATYQARYLSSDSCANKITELSGCTIYFPNNTAADVSGTVAFLQTPCWACESGKTLTLTDSSKTGVSLSDTAADWSSSLTGAFTCASGGATTTIAGCTTYINGDIDETAQNDNDGSACLITSAAKCHTSAIATDDMSANACSNYSNCSTTIATWTNGGTTANISCHVAASGYAVASTGLTGIAYTTDANCRKLLDATNCGTCTDGYWFGGATCYMEGSLYFLSAAAFLAAWFF